ncbi:MAG TPA: L,D-transpeptidase [Gemmatimonadaceae bacterium]|nr:L,D-transpeptidase [Gemmatimonadaceae bacterium]
MSSIQKNRLQKILGMLSAAAVVASLPAPVAAQGPQGGLVYDLTRPRASAVDTTDEASESTKYTFKSRADSINWEQKRSLAEHATGFRIVVSLKDAHLWTIIGNDTVLSAPAAVAKGTTLEYGKQKFTFDTPRGIRTVLGKEADPIWQPPLWLYVETAKEYDLKIREMHNGERIKLSDGRLLTMQDGEAGVIDNGEFAALPTDEHIVFDNTLFVPPMGSKNRKVEGELGKYRLILGDGYLLHGTPYKESIGLAATHGCVRLRDEDIEWLYDHVPVGTRVYIY